MLPAPLTKPHTHTSHARSLAKATHSYAKALPCQSLAVPTPSQSHAKLPSHTHTRTHAYIHWRRASTLAQGQANSGLEGDNYVSVPTTDKSCMHCLLTASGRRSLHLGWRGETLHLDRGGDSDQASLSGCGWARRAPTALAPRDHRPMLGVWRQRRRQIAEDGLRFRQQSVQGPAHGPRARQLSSPGMT